MPFKSSKHANKLHATDLKESAKKKYYSLDSQHFIDKSMQHNESAASMNRPVAKRVREHHSRNLDTSRASIKSRVSKHRQLCPDKNKADSKSHVSMHRQQDVQKTKEALVRMCLDFDRGIHLKLGQPHDRLCSDFGRGIHLRLGKPHDRVCPDSGRGNHQGQNNHPAECVQTSAEGST